MLIVVISVEKYQRIIIVMKRQPQDLYDRMLQILRDVNIARAEMTTEGTQVMRFLSEIDGAASLNVLRRSLGPENDIVKRHTTLIAQRQQLTRDAVLTAQTSMAPFDGTMATTHIYRPQLATVGHLGLTSQATPLILRPGINPAPGVSPASAPGMSPNPRMLRITPYRHGDEGEDMERSRSPTPSERVMTGPVMK